MATRKPQLQKSSADLLRYALAQAADDRELKRDLGLSQRAIAERAGISPRSLMRYLRGERSPDADTRLRLLSAAEDIRSELDERFRAEARADQVPYVSQRIPVRTKRYKRAASFLPQIGRSEIIQVSTKGLDEDAFLALLRSWHRQLSQTDRLWNIRLLVEVETTEYFGEDGPQDDDIKRSLRGRDRVPLWIPPRPFIFVSQTSRRAALEAGAEVAADVAIENLRGALNAPTMGGYQSYVGRLPSDGGFSAVAFIPVATDEETRERLRARRRAAQRARRAKQKRR